MLPSLRPESPPRGVEGFTGPEVPSRMTGAEKLMLGMFAGGWKLGGKPLGRPGCWAFACCMPGARLTPGGAIPGGADVR